MKKIVIELPEIVIQGNTRDEILKITKIGQSVYAALLTQHLKVTHNSMKYNLIVLAQEEFFEDMGKQRIKHDGLGAKTVHLYKRIK